MSIEIPNNRIPNQYTDQIEGLKKICGDEKKRLEIELKNQAKKAFPSDVYKAYLTYSTDNKENLYTLLLNKLHHGQSFLLAPGIMEKYQF